MIILSAIFYLNLHIHNDFTPLFRYNVMKSWSLKDAFYKVLFSGSITNINIDEKVIFYT